MHIRWRPLEKILVFYTSRERRGDKKGREAWSETDTEVEVGRRRPEKD